VPDFELQQFQQVFLEALALNHLAVVHQVPAQSEPLAAGCDLVFQHCFVPLRPSMAS
jgi:hypothetical protein